MIQILLCLKFTAKKESVQKNDRFIIIDARKQNKIETENRHTYQKYLYRKYVS